MSGLGKSAWFDLPARDLPAAMSFYQGLFGWDFSPLHDPALPDYWVIEKEGAWIGGLRRVSGAPAAKKDCEGPVLYITVEGLEAAAARAKELGARLVGEAVRMKGGRGAYQRFRDPEDNLLALWAAPL